MAASAKACFNIIEKYGVLVRVVGFPDPGPEVSVSVSKNISFLHDLFYKNIFNPVHICVRLLRTSFSSIALQKHNPMGVSRVDNNVALLR